VEETSTREHTAEARDRHPYLQQDSNSQSQQQAIADTRLKPGGHRDYVVDVETDFVKFQE